jgi:vacuolar-type H+-ATPase subunit I/STV1
MSRERQVNDERPSGSPNGAGVVEVETLRRAASAPHPQDDGKAEERISIFWRVFGGTILSIVALVVITVYNQFNSTLGDLRRDLNQQQEARGDLVKKEELNNRITSIWTSLREQKSVNTAVSALSERIKVLDQQLDRQVKLSEEERKEQVRKFDEQRKAVEEERKEWSRKLEETRRVAEEERRDLSRKLQVLAERLAAVEGRQGIQQAVDKTSKDK